MLGQLRLEAEPDGFEPDEPELEEPELVLPDPVPELLEPDDGVVVVELVLALEPVEPVEPEFELVAASATSAPPVTRPAVNALVASTLRNRIFTGCCPFVSYDPPRSGR